MDFDWAVRYSEVHKVCVLFERVELRNPKRWQYRSLHGYIQEGPQCGLVALAILIEEPTKDKVKEIFEVAKAKCFTYNGEMFSVLQMAELVSGFMPNHIIELFEGCLNCDRIKQWLLKGAALLVPYDTNKDNSPGFHNGHKAHWCVISGAIETDDNFFVIARHGKARNLAIWNINDLADSNQQLFDFSPDRKLQDLEYRLPEGGIAGPLGLNNKCILIYQKNV
ncbi:actin maturation protease [Rhynchophorus ferrugineus]|uniref:Actin maturation protease n=1 Tax=Rhynchophorus ferrugineus TaxID=354439 RepID=A0A834IW97_RHYFE|nr:hypothetical protein GWI33_006043 [Rhynchophorus ferrugineus]